MSIRCGLERQRAGSRFIARSAVGGTQIAISAERAFGARSDVIANSSTGNVQTATGAERVLEPGVASILATW